MVNWMIIDDTCKSRGPILVFCANKIIYFSPSHFFVYIYNVRNYFSFFLHFSSNIIFFFYFFHIIFSFHNFLLLVNTVKKIQSKKKRLNFEIQISKNETSFINLLTRSNGKYKLSHECVSPHHI